jgi:hypothetical protein
MRVHEFLKEDQVNQNFISFMLDKFSDINVTDKMNLVESCAMKQNNLTETNSESINQFFEILSHLSSHPIENQNYIVLLAAFINDKLYFIEHPRKMKFIRYLPNNKFEFEFLGLDKRKEFPEKMITSLNSVAQTFIFNNIDGYNKFLSSALLKLDEDDILSNAPLTTITDIDLGIDQHQESKTTWNYQHEST